MRRNLNTLLHRLRKALGPGWLSVENDRIALRPGRDLWVDVWEFQRLAAAGERADLQQAVALYRGDLLPEIYDDWAVMQRVALREKYLTCLLRLGQMAEQQGDLEAAFEYFHRLAGADPLREEAYRGLMHSLAGMGRLRRTGARARPGAGRAAHREDPGTGEAAPGRTGADPRRSTCGQHLHPSPLRGAHGRTRTAVGAPGPGACRPGRHRHAAG